MNRLIKLLTIFLIAGLIGTGAAVGLTGCANDDNNGGNNTEQGGSGNEQPGGDEQGGSGNEQGGEDSHQHTYDKTVWVSDNDYHWHASTCGHDDAVADLTPHDYNTRTYVCWDCGRQHIHTLADTLSADGNNGHYYACTCGHGTKFNSELVPHNMVDGVCTDCGYELQPIGIKIEKTTTEYELSASKRNVKIDTDDIKISLIMEGNEQGRELSSDEYTLILRQGKNDITPLTKKVTGGDYQIWAVLNSDPSIEYFVPVYVLDTLVDFELDTSEGTFSQKSHRNDYMTDTWRFTAIYASGNKKTISTADGVAIRDLYTTVEGNGTAIARYTEKNYRGESVTKQAPVSYTITHTDFVASYSEVTGDIFDGVTINASEDTVIKEWDGGKIIALAAQDKGMDTADGASYQDPKGIEANNRSFSKCLNVPGVGNNEARSVKIQLNPIKEGERATIIIYIQSRATDSKWVGLYDHTFVDKDSTPEAIIGELVEAGSKNEPMRKYEFDIDKDMIDEGDTFYISCETGAFWLFGIEVVYSEV